jgi:hypothetical protein
VAVEAGKVCVVMGGHVVDCVWAPIGGRVVGAGNLISAICVAVITLDCSPEVSTVRPRNYFNCDGSGEDHSWFTDQPRPFSSSNMIFMELL